MTPDGHVAIVECTTGILKAESKLSLLHSRAQTVRTALKTDDINGPRVLPVIVTTKTRYEIEAELEDASDLGILVLCREELDAIIEGAMPLPGPDELFEKALQHVALELHKRQERGTEIFGTGFPLHPTIF